MTEFVIFLQISKSDGRAGLRHGISVYPVNVPTWQMTWYCRMIPFGSLGGSHCATRWFEPRSLTASKPTSPGAAVADKNKHTRTSILNMSSTILRSATRHDSPVMIRRYSDRRT